MHLRLRDPKYFTNLSLRHTLRSHLPQRSYLNFCQLGFVIFSSCVGTATNSTAFSHIHRVVLWCARI